MAVDLSLSPLTDEYKALSPEDQKLHTEAMISSLYNSEFTASQLKREAQARLEAERKLAEMEAELTKSELTKAVSSMVVTGSGVDVSIIIDPEFESLIYPLTKEELGILEANLRVEGCLDPLTVWKGHGILMDGHNRYRLCSKLGISYKVVEVECRDRAAVRAWMVARQLGRRNLSASQRAMVRGVVTAGVLSPGSNQFKTKVEVSSGEVSDSSITMMGVVVPSSSEVSRELKVSRSTLSRCRKVESRGSPELVEAVRSSDIKATMAVRVLDLPLEEQLSAALKLKELGGMRKVVPVGEKVIGLLSKVEMSEREVVFKGIREWMDANNTMAGVGGT